MFDEIPQGYNIGWDVVGNRCVTTGACPSSSPYRGWYLRFETIIWFWDKDSNEEDKRKEMLDMIIHKNEKESVKIHGYIVSNLKKEESI